MNKWDERFLGLAKHISEWSLDPSTKVGAVIADKKNRIISVGYNGFPRGIKDDDRLLEREQKYLIIVHAEKNAMIFANKSLDDCVIYTYPFMPCSVCAASIIQSGIARVVSYKIVNPRWEKSFELSTTMFKEAGIELVLYYENKI